MARHPAEQLIGDSDRIVVAHYVGETEHEISSVSGVSGDNTGSVTEVFRKFNVVESLKGDAAAGDTVHVVFTKRTVMKTPNMGSVTDNSEVVSMTQGQSYVLFLERRNRPSNYPEQYGQTLWVIPGEPAIAKADPNVMLIFSATTRYRKDAGTTGAPSAAPFTLTKQEIAANSTR